MRKAVESIATILIILFMAAAVFTFVAPRLGWSVDVVFSGSMQPELRVGGIVVTRPATVEEIGVGDIITFYSPLNEELTSHRVVAVEEGLPFRLQTKGDANEDADPFFVPPENVVGRICLYLPYVGYAAQFIKTPLGLLLTICLPGLAIIGMEVRNIWHVLGEEEIERRYRVR